MQFTETIIHLCSNLDSVKKNSFCSISAHLEDIKLDFCQWIKSGIELLHKTTL